MPDDLLNEFAKLKTPVQASGGFSCALCRQGTFRGSRALFALPRCTVRRSRPSAEQRARPGICISHPVAVVLVGAGGSSSAPARARARAGKTASINGHLRRENATFAGGTLRVVGSRYTDQAGFCNDDVVVVQ